MNRWTFGAGLGLILFGMDIFEESIKKLWWVTLRNLLQRYTNTGIKAVTVSAIITGILNSSTLVSLLTLGFVGAGMMPLFNAVAVIVGANIGSTATGLIVAIAWSGDLNIGIVALPMISVWAILFLTTQSKYWTYRARGLVWFGLFFLGIGMFKENIDVMKATFDLTQYADMSLRVFGLIGMVVTAIVHSSGAVGVMTLAALSSGVIGFEASFAIILGANIGTTFSSLIAWLHGSTAKRQIGIANMLFNIITVLIGIVLFYPYIWLTLDVMGYRDDPVMGNAMINFIFNLTTSLAFIPFLKLFTRLITWLIPYHKEQYPLHILQYNLPNTTEQKYDADTANIWLQALDDDHKYMTRQALEYISMIWGLDTQRIENNENSASVLDNLIKFDNEVHRKLYLLFKNQMDIVLSSIQTIAWLDLSSEDRVRTQVLLNRFIALSNACKSIENIRENISTLRDNLDSKVRTLYYEMLEIVIMFNRSVYSYHSRTPMLGAQDIADVVRIAKDYRNTILTHVAPMIHQGNIGDVDVSTLVNMTGELVDCVKSLERAC